MQNRCLQQIFPASPCMPKQQKVAQNMSRANNKDTRTISSTSLWCLHHQLRKYPTPRPNTTISEFKKANVHWAIINCHNKQKTVVGQRIKITIFIIKNHYFISDPSQKNERVLNPPTFFLNI